MPLSQLFWTFTIGFILIEWVLKDLYWFDCFAILKTSISTDVKKLKDVEFPVYFTFVLNPAFDLKFLKSNGYIGPWDLFIGNKENFHIW